MPYTVSHTIIILPFLLAGARRVPIAAIAIGAMSPDALYLLALNTTGSPAKTLSGVFMFCFVCSLCLSTIWYAILEKPTLEFFKLPQRRWPLNWLSLVSLIAAILFGICCHLLWDGSSHKYGIFVMNSEFWNREVLSMPLYKWNQYGSGIVGLILLALWYVINQIKHRNEPYKGRLVTGLIIYSTSIVFFIVLANVIHDSQTTSEYAVRSAIGFMSGTVVAMCLYALVRALFFRKSKGALQQKGLRES